MHISFIISINFHSIPSNTQTSSFSSISWFFFLPIQPSLFPLSIQNESILFILKFHKRITGIWITIWNDTFKHISYVVHNHPFPRAPFPFDLVNIFHYVTSMSCLSFYWLQLIIHMTPNRETFVETPMTFISVNILTFSQTLLR